MDFAYQARGARGVETGELEAPSLAGAREKLRERKLFPVKLVEVERSQSSGRHRIPRPELLTITSQLSVMIESGVDLAEALSNISEQVRNELTKAVIDRVLVDISDGLSVTDAVRRQSKAFGDVYAASVAAGESSGRLPQVLAKLAEMLKNEIRLTSTLRAVMAYPVILLGVALLVLSALVLFILPQFAKVFEQMNADPPLLTQWLLSFSLAVRTGWMYWVPGVSGLIALAIWASGRTETRRLRDRFLLTGPLIGSAMQNLLCGRSFRMMGTLLESGVPLLETIRLCRNSLTNHLLRELLDSAEVNITNGRGMTTVLKSSPFVPPAVAQMIATGESSDRLAPVMLQVGDYFEDEGEKQLSRLAKLAEPILILGMGAVVALVVSSVVLPLLDISEGVG